MLKQTIKILLITILLLIFAGCGVKSQVTSSNIYSGTDINSLSTDNNSNKAVDDSKLKAGGEFEPADRTLVELAATKTTSEITNQTKQVKLLEGLTICIDPGHGRLTKKVKSTEPIAPGSRIMKAATASGTTGVATKITEESLNLTVSLKLKKALIEKGAKIIMVRETNVCNMTNVERTEFWNKSGADLTIRMHANGSNDKRVAGILMMVPGDKYIKDKDMLDKSAKAGQFIMESVLTSTKAKSRGTVKSTELTGFNWSDIPVMLLEMGFMTNPEEDRLLNTDSYQNKIVDGIVEGVAKYNDYLKKVKTKK